MRYTTFRSSIILCVVGAIILSFSFHDTNRALSITATTTGTTMASIGAIFSLLGVIKRDKPNYLDPSKKFVCGNLIAMILMIFLSYITSL